MALTKATKEPGIQFIERIKGSYYRVQIKLKVKFLDYNGKILTLKQEESPYIILKMEIVGLFLYRALLLPLFKILHLHLKTIQLISKNMFLLGKKEVILLTFVVHGILP